MKSRLNNNNFDLTHNYCFWISPNKDIHSINYEYHPYTYCNEILKENHEILFKTGWLLISVYNNTAKISGIRESINKSKPLWLQCISQKCLKRKPFILTIDYIEENIINYAFPAEITKILFI